MNATNTFSGSCSASARRVAGGEVSSTIDADGHLLLAMLDSTHAALTRLVGLSSAKLAAIREADTAALQGIARDECETLQELFEREKDRDAILARLAQELRWPDGGGGRLSEVADGLPEPLSSRLRAKIAGLRETAGTLQRKNRLAATVARNLHMHICAIFEDVARVNQETVIYGPDGQHDPQNRESWVDAIG